MITSLKKTELSVEQKSFLKTLLYFDIFNYPLKEDEIVRFSQSTMPESSSHTLDQLVSQKLIFRLGDFYSIQSNQELLERRVQGNQLAEKRMKDARKYSKLVFLIPFVRAVLLSGSISKGFMDDKSDIDYFIITKPERLWIVRTTLAIFRRLFLFNSHRNLCTNYFIDTDNLVIPDRNLFTAIEFCTLIPMQGSESIRKLREANEWVKDFLPACNLTEASSPIDNYFFKIILERLFSGRLISKFNLRLMTSTLKYWRKKYGSDLSENDFELAFRSKPGVSKSHPQVFQKKVMNRLSQKIKWFEEEQGVAL
jgi:hypothetical protein